MELGRWQRFLLIRMDAPDSGDLAQENDAAVAIGRDDERRFTIAYS